MDRHDSETSRVAVRRHPERGAYDRATIDAILDEGYLCHVGFVQDGQPYVIPTLYARDGDTLYLHGSHISRMLQTLGEGAPMCVTVTLVDGLVLARSTFNHSMNYRSVVVLGRGRVLEDRVEKLAALERLVEHVIPGRSADARGPNAKELRTTTVIALPIEEASAKVRTGPPKDSGKDLDLEVWAGVVPLMVTAGSPIPDEGLGAEVGIPAYLSAYTRR